ncbi:MAG: hypothetical protein J5J00_17185 [Deltaproteobacteria bacterium]|nr:hypothetical protein [Deltaproteobacteria bacterium]
MKLGSVWNHKRFGSALSQCLLKRTFTVLAVVSFGICFSKVVDDPFAGIATAAGPSPDTKTEELENNSAVLVSNQVNPIGSDIFSAEEELSTLTGGEIFPAESLERINLTRLGNKVILNEMPKFSSQHNGKVLGISHKNEFVFYTIEPELQRYAEELVRKADAPHVAIVAMDPDSGKILAIAEKSNSIKNLSLHSGFPAASLFKIITTAAALEKTTIEPSSVIKFRGGTYTLNKWNYAPDKRKDKRAMTVYEALGRSCNAVFGRIALNHLSAPALREYVSSFGFNMPIGFEHPLEESSAEIPEDDFGLSRTAAGFGDVFISPVHAAALMSGIANEGLLPRPTVINEVVDGDGRILYKTHPEMLRRIVAGETADKLLSMMESTTTVGTSRSEFYVKHKPVLPVSVAAKTGTLSGKNPKGLNHWFVAAAPISNPKIAVSVIVVTQGYSRTKASRLGRQIIEKFLF